MAVTDISASPVSPVAARLRQGGERRLMTQAEGLGPSFELTIAQAVEGEGGAFEAIYHGYARRVRAFAEARGDEDAEAVANDVMLSGVARCAARCIVKGLPRGSARRPMWMAQLSNGSH